MARPWESHSTPVSSGGFVGLLMLVLLTRPLANLALRFTPMSYFALGVLGLSVIASLAGASMLKGLGAGLLGLMVATVGSDPISGVPRFTFGQGALLDGIAPILVMVGLFAVSELFLQASQPAWGKAARESTKIRLPSGKLRRRLIKPQLIGSLIGTVEGVIPGAGARSHHFCPITKPAAGRTPKRNSAGDHRKESQHRRPPTTRLPQPRSCRY